MTLRLHPDEAPVLREHALPLARKALDTLSARYGHTVDGRVLVEIFPKHDDFAVRNVGLPGMVGALGACFGRVVTLDSPRARPPGTFNWQATLWHEMAHVVTLQMSNNRIPRWLTEGISVFEEQRARPEWGREMELRFADALERGEILPLAELNRGFMSGETIALAYYQASLLVDHLVVTRGEPALQTLVRAFADGVSVDEAMRRAVGPTLAELEPEFVASVTERFAAVLAARRGPEDIRLTARTPRETIETLAAEYPGNVDLQLRLGDVLAAAGEIQAAYDAWERAAYLLPSLVGNDSPLARIATLASSRGDTPRAIDALERLLARDDTNIEAARTLASLVDPSRDPARAARAWARVAELDPFDATASAALGRHALDTSAPEVAARWFRAALAAGPVDKAAAYCDLAESYLAVGAAPQARAPGAGGARGRAVLRARSGSAAHARGWGPLMRPRALILAGVLVAALAAAIPSPPTALAQGQPGAHLAGLQWTFVRIKYTAALPPRQQLPVRLLGRPLGHRRAGRRAESVAAAQVGDGHRSRPTRPCSPSRTRRSGSTRGSTSSSLATCVSRSPKCQSCASSCCAAARPPSTTSMAPMSGRIWCGSCSACFPTGGSWTCR